jgi:hypothetical protein
VSGFSRSVVLLALGIGVSTPLFAVEGQSTQPYPGDYQAALRRCDNPPEAEQAKRIVNIRPTEPAATSSARGEVNAVTDGQANRDAEHAAAERECQAVIDSSERQRCVENAKEHFGRI